jgi:hypothetical protein
VAHGVRCYKCGRNGSFDCAALRSGRQSGNVVSWRTVCAATMGCPGGNSGPGEPAKTGLTTYLTT